MPSKLIFTVNYSSNEIVKAEDSPWAQFFEEDSTEDDETCIKSIQEKEIDNGLMTALL